MIVNSLPKTEEVNLWNRGALTKEEMREILAMILSEIGATIYRNPETGILYFWRDGHIRKPE